MSRLTDYSKFDHLVDSDDDNDDDKPPQQQQQQTPVPEKTSGYYQKDPTTGRYVFYYQSRKIYEWEQTLETVTLYVDAPPGKKAKDFVVRITATHLQVGLRGHDSLFLDDDFSSLVDTTESCWFLEDAGVLQIVLQKQRRGETWEQVLVGREAEVNPLLQQEMREQLLLERFQEENPGMDFRDAKFNGSVPDPRTYMGGIGYK
ncbi:hypothetical protein MHU86_18126 [Fragilaria crotonensis]|nr:hypothetical protein MHU86_18126 [Fragilaria crotonensis]